MTKLIMENHCSEKQRILRRSVRTFCDREIVPIAKEIDEEARFPWEVVEKMGKLGFFGIQTPTDLSGAAMDTLSYTAIIEEISKACAALGLCVTVHNSVAVYPILAYGNDEQKKRWVPELARGEKIGAFCLTEPNAGSDASGIEATAMPDGHEYIINANKVLITNGGVADTCLIFARTDPSAGRRGISVLVVERGTPGFKAGDLENLMGMRANPVSSIRLTDCRVPRGNLLGKEGMGLTIGMTALDAGRIGIAAQAVGIAQAALEAAVRYAGQRHQFGVPIAGHQAIQMMIADMATQVDASRLLVQRAAMMRDQNVSFSQEAAMAKLYAAEASSKVTDMAIQIHGGYGYTKSYPVERYYRDARVTRIYEGTSEIHRMVVARGVMKQYGS
jgi:butyryl-CoA dehydrogenase